jgi:hypothetical protein
MWREREGGRQRGKKGGMKEIGSGGEEEKGRKNEGKKNKTNLSNCVIEFIKFTCLSLCSSNDSYCFL